MRHLCRWRGGDGEAAGGNNCLITCSLRVSSFLGLANGFFYPLTAGMGSVWFVVSHGYDDYDGLGSYWFITVTFGLGFGLSASYRL